MGGPFLNLLKLRGEMREFVKGKAPEGSQEVF